MTLNKFLMLALTGCVAAVSAYAIRRHAGRGEAKRDAEDLQTWEGEGGQPPPPAARPSSNA